MFMLLICYSNLTRTNIHGPENVRHLKVVWKCDTRIQNLEPYAHDSLNPSYLNSKLRIGNTKKG